MTLSRSLRGLDGGVASVAPGQRKSIPDGPGDAYEWAVLHRKLEGRAFTLERHRPLKAIYRDPHPHKVIGKPAQRGVSELAINEAGFALDRGADVWTQGEKDGLNVAYIFPKKEALGDFSKERLSGLAHESPYLERLFGDDEFNAVTFKQVRNSYLYLRGGWSTSALKSFPADVLVLDEYDEMAPSAVALARRRLNASLVHRELDISTPSQPGRGIHRLYLESDQHVYEQRHACGSWVVYDFLRDVRVAGQAWEIWGGWAAEQVRRSVVALTCPACGGEVSDAERLSEGRWTPQAPEVQGLRGYWIPPLAFPVANLMRLAAGAVNPDPFEREQFFQSDIGVPYAAEGSKVTLEQILQLASPLENGRLPNWSTSHWKDATMGVDVGFRKHWKVSATGADGRRYVRAVGHADEWSDIDGLMRHFRIRRCVVDAQPDLDAAKQFAARWPGRVLRAFYPGASGLKGQLFNLEGLDLKKLLNKKNRVRLDVVNVNRTMAMDRVRDMIVRIAEIAPLEVVNDPLVQEHLQSPTRVTAPDVRGQPIPQWVNAGPDHIFHAWVYDLIARETLPGVAAPFHALAGGQRQAMAPPRPGAVAAPPQPTAGAASQRRRRSEVLRAALRSATTGGQIAERFGSPYAAPRRHVRG